VKKDSFSCLASPPENAVKRQLVPILIEQGSPNTVRVEGKLRTLIVDTGSKVSLLEPEVSRSDVSVTVLKPFGVIVEDI
jgi:hypothetical protein